MTSPTVQIFISSTWLDMQPERKAIEDLAQRFREVKFVGMEYFGSRDETTQRASLDEVNRSHLYIGIIGGRYGSGITEDEYRRARERKLPCYIYLKRETPDTPVQSEQDAEKLASLKNELRGQHTVTEFDNPSQLAVSVSADLHRWLADNYFPTRPTVNAFHQLPSPPRDFIGRETEMDELMRALLTNGVTIYGLQGLGGVGKTALALKLAQQLSVSYTDAQFYLDLKGASKTPLSAADAMAHIIRAYQPTAELPESEAELSALYRSVLHDQRALLLMDNAANREQVEPLIPPESCVMLITSRQRFTLPGLFTRNLEMLPTEDAQKLLLKIAPHIDGQADMVARLCGYLPLTLRLAASTLAERVDLSVEDYVRRLTTAQQRLKLIDASLSLSYELLSPEMQERWRVLAIFPDTFASAAAAAVWAIDLDAAQDALSELVKYSLLEWNKATTRYRLHDLVRLFADARLSEAERNTGQRRHASHYLSVSREANGLYRQGGEELTSGIALFDLEWPNIQAGQVWALKHAVEEDEVAALCSKYFNVGAHLLDLRRYPRERISGLTVALDCARRLQDRTAEAKHLGNLANAHWRLGKWALATDYYEKQLDIARRIKNQPIEGNALEGLGWTYAKTGERNRALDSYEQALIIIRKIGERRREGNILLGLGNLYYALDKERSAFKSYKKALRIAREFGDRKNEGNALGGLGMIYAKSGKTDRALKSYEEGLAIARKLGSPRGKSNILWGLSQLLYKLGERDKAIAHAKEALETYEQIEDPSVTKVRKKLAEWHKAG